MPFPSIATVDHQRSPRERPVMRFQQDTEASAVVELRDHNGQVLDLTDVGRITLVCKDLVQAVTPYISQTVTVAVAEEGKVAVNINASDLDVAGVFLAEFALYEGTSGSPYARVPGYMDVVQSLGSSSQVVGVHIEDIRTQLYDRSAEDNFLLNDVEFTDSQICWAVLKSVNTFNEIQPMASTTYSAVDFPHREQWIDGTVAELLLMAARNYARNDLSYQAGGTAINDKNKLQSYQQLGKQMQEEYKAWARELKIGGNMMDFITTSSAWGYG